MSERFGGISTYLPISRCWRGGNCSTSWTNSATSGCDSDCCPRSSSLARRDSCMTCGWSLTSGARFLNRPRDCVKHKKNKHDRSITPPLDLAPIWSGGVDPVWEIHCRKYLSLGWFRYVRRSVFFEKRVYLYEISHIFHSSSVSFRDQAVLPVRALYSWINDTWFPKGTRSNTSPRIAESQLDNHRWIFKIKANLF